MFKKTMGRITAIAVVFCLLVSSVFAREAAKKPQKIISLSPAATEILFAVGAGDNVVAVDEYSDYPSTAKDLPKIGGFDGKTISIEKILSFEPDFVYITKGMHDFLIPTFDKYGIQYYVSTGVSVDSVKQEIREIGSICGIDTLASEAIAKIDNAIAQATSILATKEKAPAVYYEVWTPPYMSLGGDTFISDVIAKAGGKNIFSSLSGWPTVSEEEIIAANPEVILIQKSSNLTVDNVKERKGWSEISAVKNNKVVIVDDNIFSRPSPRIGEAIIQLSNILK